MRCKAPLGLVLAALLVLPGAGLTARAAYLRAKGRLAEALIRRAWSETLASGRPTPPWRGADTYPIGRLLIPRLGYDEVVLEGASPRVLAFGPARLVSAAAPGEPGNVVLAGHRTSWFRPLQDVRVGDLVELVWRDPATGAERRRRYAVRRLAVVRPEDVGRRLRPTADDRLTLVTCYPFGRSPQSPLRLLVTAEPSPHAPRARGPRPHATPLPRRASADAVSHRAGRWPTEARPG